MAECADCHHVWTGTHEATKCQHCGLSLGDFQAQLQSEEDEE